MWDLRPVARHPLTVLRGLPRALHEACDAAKSLRELAAAGRTPSGFARDEVERALDALVASRLVLSDGERHLALAVPLGRFAPEGRALDRFWRVARAMGRTTGDGIVIPVHNYDAEFCTLRARNRSASPPASESARTCERLTPDRFSVNRHEGLVLT